MAGFVGTLATWDALLQEDYIMGKIASAINEATPFKDELKKVGMTSGRERVYAVQVEASQGTAARAEGAQSPPYGDGEYRDAKVHAKYNYARFKINGPSEQFGDKKAFVKFALRKIQDAKLGLKLSIGRQCWGDGQGTLALVSGSTVAGSTVITAISAYGVLWGSVATLTTLLIRKNMTVQFGTEDNNGNGYTITAVTSTTFTVKPALQNTVADQTKISILKAAFQEVTGAMQFMATAAFMTTLGLPTTVYNGIDRSVDTGWEGNVLNANAALSLQLIRSTRDAIYKRTDDEETNLMIGSTEMRRDYEALLVAAQRFTPPQRLAGGYEVLSHDGLNFACDSKAPIKALFFFDTAHIAWAQTGDPFWQQDGNGGIMHILPGTDAKEALLCYYGELDVDEPRRQGLLYNVTTVPA